MPTASKLKPQASYDEILTSLGAGTLDGITVTGTQILVGIWMRPETTKGGIILTHNTLTEDQWQGKVGIVLKRGPRAFKDDAVTKFDGIDPQPGEAVLFRVSDGFALDINEVHCRLMDDIHVRMLISDPTVIY